MFNAKRKHFKDKVTQVQRTIWDLEFKRFKTLEIREEVRQEYDEKSQRKVALEAQIASEKTKPTLPKDEAARLDDALVLLNKDLERHVSQINQLDLELDGTRPTHEYPDGVNGIKQQLDSYRELLGMLKDYCKGL